MSTDAVTEYHRACEALDRCTEEMQQLVEMAKQSASLLVDWKRMGFSDTQGKLGASRLVNSTTVIDARQWPEFSEMIKAHDAWLEARKLAAGIYQNKLPSELRRTIPPRHEG